MNSTHDYERYHINAHVQKKPIDDKNFTHREVISFVSNYIKKDFQLLDLGCGVGTIDFYLAPKVKSLIGIDVSKHAIEIAIKNSRKFGLVKKISYFTINFPNETINKKFDVVLCSEVLEHVLNDRLALTRIYKLLKKGGFLILTSPSVKTLFYRFGLLKEFDKRVGHLRRYSPDKLATLLKSVGFTPLKIEEKEGILRNILFSFKAGDHINHLANRFSFVSDLLTLVDRFLLKIFGGSSIYLAAQK